MFLADVESSVPEKERVRRLQETSTCGRGLQLLSAPLSKGHWPRDSWTSRSKSLLSAQKLSDPL